MGQGKRPVRVGYIQATPVWKTSYRLVLNDKDKPFLQGWAIVENTTEADWDNGQADAGQRPADLATSMDLYEPLYVQRPVEQLNLYASLRPQVYGQDMKKADEAFRELSQRRAKITPGYAAKSSRGAMMGGGMADGRVPAEAAPNAPAPAAECVSLADARIQARNQPPRLGQCRRSRRAVPV